MNAELDRNDTGWVKDERAVGCTSEPAFEAPFFRGLLHD
jgi:hypothetical protein